MPLPSDSADAVVVAQAFHWFDGRRALHEIHRVLKFGKGLGLIWNSRDSSLKWVAELDEIINSYDKGNPRYVSRQWRETFKTFPGFTTLEHKVVPHVQYADMETLVNRVVSISYIAALLDEERDACADRVRSLLKTHLDTRNRTQYELPYHTDVYWCFKK